MLFRSLVDVHSVLHVQGRVLAGLGNVVVAHVVRVDLADGAKVSFAPRRRRERRRAYLVTVATEMKRDVLDVPLGMRVTEDGEEGWRGGGLAPERRKAQGELGLLKNGFFFEARLSCSMY